MSSPERPPRAEDLYRELGPAVLGYLHAQRVPDPEDLLGEVFLQVARDLPGFEGSPSRLRSWVFSIAHNRVVDDARRRARRPATPVPDPPDRPLPDPDPMDPELVGALAELTPAQRQVVVLRFVADLPLEEVARICGRRIGAVKTMQRRALRKLAKLVSPDR